MFIVLTPMHGTGNPSDCDVEFIKSTEELEVWLQERLDDGEEKEILTKLPKNSCGDFEWQTADQVVIIKGGIVQVAKKEVVTKYELVDKTPIPF